MTATEKLTLFTKKHNQEIRDKRQAKLAYYEIRKIMKKCADKDFKFRKKSFRQIHKIVEGNI